VASAKAATPLAPAEQTKFAYHRMESVAAPQTPMPGMMPDGMTGFGGMALAPVRQLSEAEIGPGISE
jgi:hypothetical protein